MYTLVSKLVGVTTLLLCVFESTLFFGYASTRGNSGLLVPESDVYLGQPMAGAVLRACWEIVTYTGHCQFPVDDADDVFVTIFVEEGLIVPATYEANDLLDIYSMVQHWGLPTVIKRQPYLDWEQLVYGIITPKPPGSTHGYALMAWSAV